MSLIKCIACLGKKTFVGLGLIEHKCDHCQGIGWKTVSANDESSPVVTEANEKPIRKKKRKEISVSDA